MELTEDWVATPADDELRRIFADPDLDDSAWEPIRVPGHWRSAPAFSDFDGPLLHRTRFLRRSALPGRRFWLRFDGLFQQGDVWLDGAYLGDTEGYFVPHTFEITEAVAERTEHVLAVELTCHPQDEADPRPGLTGAFQDGRCVDPTWNPGGIWRPVSLVETGPVRIARLTARCTHADETRAVLSFEAGLDAAAAVDAHVRTTVGAVDHGLDHTLAAGPNTVEWSVTIDDPELWWPHALGEPHLVPVEVEVRLRDAAGSVVSDRRRFRSGLRTLGMRNRVLAVNGERLFCKGTNLLPARMALGEASTDDCRRDVALAKNAGLDLVRLHAHVARPETYDAADEAGMLVWQDFPLQAAASRQVRWQAVRQAAEMVGLVGHHPSVAVWCAPSRPVRRAIHRTDGTRPVVDPSGGLPGAPGPLLRNERRLPGLARAVPRLVRFPTELGASREPDPEHQATVVRRQIEELRRLKYRPTGGFAQFCFHEIRPGAAWGALDHDRRPRPAHAALVAACRPVVVVADRLPATLRPGQALALDVHVVSDRRIDLDGHVDVELRWEGGAHRWAFEGEVPADSCVRVGTLQFEVPGATGELVLELSGQVGDEPLDNRYTALVAPPG